MDRPQRHCNLCKRDKPASDFERKGLRQCRTCRNSRRRELGKSRRIKDPEFYYRQHRKHHLKAKYGLTEEAYLQILKSQNNLCAICLGDGANCSSAPNKLNIDHDHNTGTVRGLLCWNCNCAIGLLKDDVGLLSRAIGYLAKHSSTPKNE